MIKAEVAREFPAAMEMICQAQNTLQAVSKAEDEMQALAKILAHIKSWRGHSPTWNDIRAEVLKSRPKCAGSCPALFGFALKFGGSDFMASTQQYVAKFGQINRTLGLEVWATISLDIKGVKDHLRWRHMLIKFGFCNTERPLSLGDVTRRPFRYRLGSLAC